MMTIMAALCSLAAAGAYFAHVAGKPGVAGLCIAWSVWFALCYLRELWFALCRLQEIGIGARVK